MKVIMEKNETGTPERCRNMPAFYSLGRTTTYFFLKRGILYVWQNQRIHFLFLIDTIFSGENPFIFLDWHHFRIFLHIYLENYCLLAHFCLFCIHTAPVAQLDRALDYGSKG